MTAGIEALVRHRPPFLLLDEIVGDTGDGFACWGRVPAELTGADEAPSLLAIEMGAQAAAALQALGHREAGTAPPASGYLVTIEDARLACPTLPVERRLWVEVRPAGSLLALARFRITVAETPDAEPLAEASISTFAETTRAPKESRSGQDARKAPGNP